MEILKFIFLSALVCFAMFLLVMLVKNEVTYRQQIRICDAIYRYSMVCARSGVKREVEFEDIEPYNSTLFRLWDWGYTRILPPDKFEIIKDYVK